jgi:hypothetical protein
MAYYAAFFTLSETNQPERALNYLEQWVRANPTDERAQALLDEQRRSLGMGGSSPPPPPPAPVLP